jgi:adenylate kinase
MNILITGVQNVIKDSVVKLAVERIEGKVKLKTLSFSDFAEEGTNEYLLMKNTQRRLMEGIQMKMLEPKTENILINGYCTVKTKFGFAPVLTEDSASIFRPGIIVCLETDPLAVPGKMDNPREFQEHQSVEREFSILYSAKTGASLKIIKSGKEGARQGAEQLFDLLKDALVSK